VSVLPFLPDQTYDNVFLVFVDAAGHSSIVTNNPRDRVAQAFDLLQERIARRLRTLAGQHRCARARLWRWAGDGGFLVVHDDSESVARDVVLEFTRSLFELDLHHLRDEFARLGIFGALHIRVGLHRGVITYRGEGQEGSIYSPDINLAAHLEKVAPVDTAAVSETVYRVAGKYAELLEPVGAYDDHRVYLFTGVTGPGSGARAWLAARGLAGGGQLFGYAERLSQQEKARLVNAATKEIIELGSALRTTSRYLVTTERPAYFRDAMLAFLHRGGRCRYVMLDPAAPAARLLSEQLREDISTKIAESMATLRRFRERHGAVAEGLEVYQTARLVNMAGVAIDLKSANGLLLMSPYLSPMELCEMPHYLVSPSAGPVFGKLRDLVRTLAHDDVTRVL
jgi:class 3 adenylate cyclase